MNDYLKLKTICDKIGYKIKKPFSISGGQDGEGYFIISGNNLADVREIIFTQEFMDLLKKYYIENINDCGDKTFPGTLKMSNDFLGILENLNNPVQYLYNLLELYNNLLPNNNLGIKNN